MGKGLGMLQGRPRLSTETSSSGQSDSSQVQQIGWCVIRVVWREQSREEPSWHRDRRVRSLRLGRMEGSKVAGFYCLLLC